MMPFGNMNTMRQPLARAEPARGAEARAAVARRGRVVAPLGAERAGIGLDLELARRDGRRQADVGRNLVHGEGPAVAVDVPVELVVLLEEADLEVGPVGDFVDVGAARQHHAGVADAHAHAVLLPLQRVVLGLPVAPHRQHLERHRDLAPVAVPVVGREIAQDAALDLLALDLHVDGFEDGQLPLGADPDLAVEGQDPFLRADCRRECKETQNSEPSHSCTFTASRSSVSKKGSGWKPKALATMTCGNDSSRSRYCFTAPL